MKLTKSHLKELIRQSLQEDWWDNLSSAEQSAYMKKHPKSAKAQQAKKEKPRAATPAPDDYDPTPTKNPFSKEFPELGHDQWNKKHGKDKDDSEDGGGPSYSDVPKGAKSTAQAKLMKKNDEVAKEFGANDTEDLIMGGNVYDIDDYLENVPDQGQDWDQALELMNLIRDEDQGLMDYDEDTLQDLRKGVLDLINTPGKKGSGKSSKETGDEMDKAASDANTKMHKDQINNITKKAKKGQDYLKSLGWKKEQFDTMGWTYQMGELKTLQDNPDEFDDLMYNNVGDAIDGVEEQLDFILSQAKKNAEKKNESINLVKEFKGRRCTVKEVRMWMKKLEENRYKKVYNSDARRVAWMCNHIGENLENMPKSMRKKWTKAQYGRERYLAKEFLKSQKQKMDEIVLRDRVRNIILKSGG